MCSVSLSAYRWYQQWTKWWLHTDALLITFLICLHLQTQPAVQQRLTNGFTVVSRGNYFTVFSRMRLEQISRSPLHGLPESDNTLFGQFLVLMNGGVLVILLKTRCLSKLPLGRRVQTVHVLIYDVSVWLTVKQAHCMKTVTEVYQLGAITAPSRLINVLLTRFLFEGEKNKSSLPTGCL